MQVDTRQLREYLLRVVCNEEIEVKGKGKVKKNALLIGQPKVVIEKEKNEPVAPTKKKSLKSMLAIKKQSVVEKEEPVASPVKAEVNVENSVTEQVSTTQDVVENGNEEIKPEIQLEDEVKTSPIDEVKEKELDAETEMPVEESPEQVEIEIPYKEEAPVEEKEEDKSMIFSIFKKKEEKRTDTNEDILAMLEKSATKDIKLPKQKKKEISHSEVFNQLTKNSEVERDYQAEAI